MSLRGRRLSTRTVFRGRVFRVERDRVRLPNNRTVAQDVVRHSRSVVLVPQPSPGHVILIRQYRYAVGGWIWELPAGTLDPEESPAHAARRECEEEIGLTPRRLARLGAFYPTPGFCDEVMIFYRCTQLVRPTGRVAHDPDEVIKPKVFTVIQAKRLIGAGRIQDMKTVVGLGML
jgi:ADP-ribose pyrophosphatase